MISPGTRFRVSTPLYGGNFVVTAESGELANSAVSPSGSEPYVLPGELVQGEPLPGEPGEMGTGADPLRILEPSADRTLPGCVHFGVCGGCQYQHAVYPAQLQLKRTILAGLLAEVVGAAGGGSLPPIHLHAAEPWGYRNRIRLRLQPDAAGVLRVGYSVRASNSFLPVTMCPIAAPLLWRAAQAVEAAAAGPHALLGGVSEFELFSDAAETALQITFFVHDPHVVREEAAAFQRLCAALLRAVPQLAGAAAVPDPRSMARRARRAWAGESWGAPGLAYTVPGVDSNDLAATLAQPFWVSRGSFFQVNRFLAERLRTVVTWPGPADQAGRLAWDLYAGVGLFTRPLAARFAHVVAVEGADSAARDLSQLSRAQPSRAQPKTQAGAAPQGTIEAVHAPTLDFLKARRHLRERPDLVVLDPPRAGLGQEAATLLAGIGPTHIVYVSCDPVSLCRDLTILFAAGYRVLSLDLVDLFPQTAHLETVLRLERRKPGDSGRVG